MRALPLLILLIAACGPSRTTKFRLEPMRGVGGAWQRVIKGKEIRIETQGKDLRVRHGPHNFKLLNVGEFEGDYTYYTFEIRGGKLSHETDALPCPHGEKSGVTALRRRLAQIP